MTSKKFRASLESLDADQITEKVGEYCEKLSHNLTDSSIGTMRTAFNVLAITQREHGHDLLKVAAKKNGVPYTTHDATIVAIAEAAEKRGSPASAKVRSYITTVRKIVKAMEVDGGAPGSSISPLAVAKRIRTAKRLGPSLP